MPDNAYVENNIDFVTLDKIASENSADTQSFAQGSAVTASGVIGSFAQGSSVTASGPSSFAQGSSTTASGGPSFAQGSSATALGNASFALGGNTTAVGANSFAFGDGATAAQANCWQIGQGVNNSSNSLQLGEYGVGAGLGTLQCQDVRADGIMYTEGTIYANAAGTSFSAYGAITGADIYATNNIYCNSGTVYMSDGSCNNVFTCGSMYAGYAYASSVYMGQGSSSGDFTANGSMTMSYGSCNSDFTAGGFYSQYGNCDVGAGTVFMAYGTSAGSIAAQGNMIMQSYGGTVDATNNGTVAATFFAASGTSGYGYFNGAVTSITVVNGIVMSVS